MFDVVVIGSGPGGYVAAIKCAQLGLKTACVEKGKLGGTCLNVGCIPSKSLLHSTEILAEAKHTLTGDISLDFVQMMERKTGVIAGFNQGIEGLFKKNKITHIEGTASFKTPNAIEVGGETIEAKNFIIATGSSPTELPFLPFDEKSVLSSTGALNLEKAPKSLLIVGAGVIGVELGSVYARLGTEVTFVEYMDRVLPPFDPVLSKEAEKILKKQGMTFHLATKVTGAEIQKNSITLQLEGKEPLTAEKVLVSVGRRPYVQDLNLEALNITPSPTIPIDANFRTSHPHIYAIGDVVDGPMLAHKASEEGISVAELIAGHTPTLEYMTIPSVVYTTPEVASVGLTESQAKELNITTKSASFPFKANSRARCIGQEEGLVKLVADAKTHILLGAHIIGPLAGELIQEAALAIQTRATAEVIAATSHAHPTLSEALKEAALALTSKPIHM